MKETYPTSTTWPYVLSVLLLLAVVVAPPTKWVGTVDAVRTDLATWFSPAGPPAQSLAVTNRDCIVVSFDPRSLNSATSTEQPTTGIQVETELIDQSSTQHASDSLPMLWEEIPLTLSTLPEDLAVTAEPSEDSTTLLPTTPASALESNSNRVSSLPTEEPGIVEFSGEKNTVDGLHNPESVEAFVWQPPADWKPTLIQPLDELGVEPTKAASVEVVASGSNTTKSWPIDFRGLQEIEVQPPVANRVARLPRIDRDQIQRRVYESKARANPLLIEAPSASFSSELATDSPDPIGSPSETEQELPSEAETTEPHEPQLEGSKIAENAADPAPNENVPSQAEPKQSRSLAKQPENRINQASRMARVADVWPNSIVLGDLLLEAKRDVVLTNWAISIEQTLGVLQGNRVTGAADQLKALDQLRKLATIQVDRTRWPQSHRELHDRVRLALLRRVDVWQPLMQVAYTEPSSFATYRAQKQLKQTAATLKQTLSADENAGPWIEYLALDTLQNLQSDKIGYRKLADRILLRMYSSQLNDQQREFLQSQTFGSFETDLRVVIAKSVHPSELIAAIEAYETAPSRSTANDVILLIQRWHSAPESELYRPAIAAITTLYRNANLRVSVSEDLINRFVPAIRQYAERVNDTILGAAVTGRSSTHSNLAVKLIPDDQSIRLGLLAAGTVESNTASRKGPVTAFSRGQSSFAAGKEVRLSPQGITTSATETRALSGSEVVGIRTDWDDVPFLGSIIRSMAQDEIDGQQRQVEAEMEIRVRRQAQQRMDRELESRVARAGKNLENNLVKPLRRLQLDPRAMEMRTTHDRAIMRTRLAGPWQFGAHSPRPQIRSDSVMSFQIHQSAANNVLEQLQLQNRRMTIEELMATLSQRFGVPLQVIDETHKDIVVKFGEHPMEFDFNSGQVQVTIHFAELERQNRRWKDFSIRGTYRADVEQLDIALEREGSVSLIGDRIGLRDQLALRAIASKVFGKHQRLQILGDAILQQPQLCNLTITQFTIRDGWLAVALGEKNGESRMADRSHGMQSRTR